MRERLRRALISINRHLALLLPAAGPVPREAVSGRPSPTPIRGGDCRRHAKMRIAAGAGALLRARGILPSVHGLRTDRERVRHERPDATAAASGGQADQRGTGRLGTRTRRTAPAHRARQGTRRQGARGAPAQGRPADGARTHRPHAGPGQLPRDRRHRRQGDLRRRQPRHPVLHARPTACSAAARWMAARWWSPATTSPCAADRRMPRSRASRRCRRRWRRDLPHADHPADRRLRRRRLGEDDRDDRPRQPAGRADGDHLVRPGRQPDGHRAGGRRWAWARSPGWARRGWRPAITR